MIEVRGVKEDLLFILLQVWTTNKSWCICPKNNTITGTSTCTSLKYINLLTWKTCRHKRTSPQQQLLLLTQLGGLASPVSMVGINIYLQLSISTYSSRNRSIYRPKYNLRYKRMQISQVHKAKDDATKTPPPPLLSLLSCPWKTLGLVCPVRMVGIKIYLQLNISTYSFRYRSMYHHKYTITGTSIHVNFSGTQSKTYCDQNFSSSITSLAAFSLASFSASCQDEHLCTGTQLHTQFYTCRSI